MHHYSMAKMEVCVQTSWYYRTVPCFSNSRWFKALCVQVRPHGFESCHGRQVQEAEKVRGESDLDEDAVVGRRGFARRARLRAQRNSSRRKRSRDKKASRYRARTPFRWGVLMDTCSFDKH